MTTSVIGCQSIVNVTRMFFTVLLPTFNHGATIAFALASLRQQTHANFEAIIVGDGIPEALLSIVESAVATDSRFRLITFPKHERRGEPYRHQVLTATKSDAVCYLTDRDLWLPEHLERMAHLLSQADYGHTLGVHVLPDSSLRAYACDLSQPGYRHMMQTTNDNRMPFSTFGHTMAAYRALPEGWATTPADEWTDLTMFRKFMRHDTLRGQSGTWPTAVTFPTPPRATWSTEQRLAELEMWQSRLSDDVSRARFQCEMLEATLCAQRQEISQISLVAQQLIADHQRTNAAPAPTSFSALRSYR
jgi:GalNAc5-diNAcBac-PP-undecaprenol beta-1,3-glucosyltransferase